jgi:hypothetical protein
MISEEERSGPVALLYRNRENLNTKDLKWQFFHLRSNILIRFENETVSLHEHASALPCHTVDCAHAEAVGAGCGVVFS